MTTTPSYADAAAQAYDRELLGRAHELGLDPTSVQLHVRRGSDEYWHSAGPVTLCSDTTTSKRELVTLETFLAGDACSGCSHNISTKGGWTTLERIAQALGAVSDVDDFLEEPQSPLAKLYSGLTADSLGERLSSFGSIGLPRPLSRALLARAKALKARGPAVVSDAEVAELALTASQHNQGFVESGRTKRSAQYWALANVERETPRWGTLFDRVLLERYTISERTPKETSWGRSTEASKFVLAPFSVVSYLLREDFSARFAIVYLEQEPDEALRETLTTLVKEDPSLTPFVALEAALALV